MADSIAAAVPFINAASTAIGAGASAYAALKPTKTPKSTGTPTLTPVATAPTADDAAIQKARKAAIMRRQSQFGRESTNLTDDEKLG